MTPNLCAFGNFGEGQVIPALRIGQARRGPAILWLKHHGHVGQRLAVEGDGADNGSEVWVACSPR